MARTIDINSDLGEGYGPWRMGEDAAMLDVVSSASIACGGHAGDPETMFSTLSLAAARGISVGAHPGYPDRQNFGRRVLPMTPGEIERLVACQVGALIGAATLVGVPVRYVKPHGALANLAAADVDVARAIVAAVRALGADMALLAIAGTVLERTGRQAGLAVYSEIYADRAYLASGQLVPRSQPGAVIDDAEVAAERLVGFIGSGQMPTIDGGSLALCAHSVCVHGDTPHALTMASLVRQRLEETGIGIASFIGVRTSA